MSGLGESPRLCLWRERERERESERARERERARAQLLKLECRCDAQHRTGAVGQAPQPSNEAYENHLAFQVRRVSSEKPLWIEHESRHVGKAGIGTDVTQSSRGRGRRKMGADTTFWTGAGALWHPVLGVLRAERPVKCSSEAIGPKAWPQRLDRGARPLMGPGPLGSSLSII